jgi:DNA-binding Lrp family transcriptional regulator
MSKLQLEPVKKEVQLIRKEKKSHIPTEVQQTAIHRLGSVWVDGQPHKQISPELEKALLPLVNDVPADADNFRIEARDYWRSLTVKVPSEGTVLNVSVGKDGMPVAPKDYLTYVWIESHPHVAKSKDEMNKFGKFRFYLHDPERESKQENDRVKSRAKAYKEFVKVLDDPKQTERVLRVMGNQNPAKMSAEQRENALHKQMEANPAKFYEIATDDTLAVKDFIAELLEKEIIRKSGNTYFYMDEMIGETLDETVAFLKNKKNSSVLNDLKAKLKDQREVTPV